MATGMVRLGIWQLDRLHGRKAANVEIAQAMNAPPVSLTSTRFPLSVYGFSRVSVTGTWVPRDTVYRRYPLHDGQQGYEVIEPLRVDDGLIVVNRGWIPLDQGRLAPRPSGSGEWVTIEGLLRDTENGGGSINANDANPSVPTIEKMNVARLGPLMGNETLAPNWVQLTAPVTQGDPVPLDRPVLDEGPHFSYMLQWFSFAAITVIGWLVLVFHSAFGETRIFRRRGRDQDQRVHQ